ncbi:MAG: type VII toxin-antitoxin system MntA family adenylyltransferase antitoxin [Candidatus Longimicrobiales bacterium M2_2A_002]
MPTPDEIRTALAVVAERLPELAAAYLYGSAVTGEVGPGSDLDIALVVVPGAEPDPLFAETVSARLGERLGFAGEVDAHVVDHLPLAVRGRVVTEGVPVFERDPEQRVEFETHTRRLYFDFLPFLERDAREALRG